MKVKHMRAALVDRGLWPESDQRNPAVDRAAYVQMVNGFSGAFLDSFLYRCGGNPHCGSKNKNVARVAMTSEAIATYDSMKGGSDGSK